MKHRFVPDAADEVDVALTWSANADDLDMAISVAIAQIIANPAIAGRFPRTRARQFIVQHYPYSLIYAEETNEIVIYAFAHHKRKPGYWRNRLRNT